MMTFLQTFIIAVYFLANFLVFIKGYNETKVKRNAYGETPFLFPLGIFVCGDAVVFGLFWTLSSLVSLFLKDWYLFLLTVSVFWAVRSFGETIYWFNQQFSTIIRNKPEKMFLYKIFQNDSVWFAYQTMWQCLTILSIISSMYFSKLWLS